MDGFYDLTLLPVTAGDPAADTANEFVVETVRCFGDLLHGDHIVAIVAYQDNGIVDADIGDISNIHHHLVHTDAAQDGCPAAADQDIEFAGQAAAVAVGVTHGNSRDPAPEP